VKRGTFILVSKEDVDAARTAPSQDPTDYKGIALRSGADYALEAKVEEFSAKTTSGYSAVDENDSQLEAETGSGKSQRLYKVRQMVGRVAVKLTFVDTHTGEVRSAVAEADGTATAENKEQAEYLPPKLRFLEGISNDAFQKFFEKY
jgi:hypothetical protein